MMLTFNTIEAQRRTAGPFIVGLVWALVPVCAAVGGWLDHDLMPTLAGALACAGLATSAWWFGGTLAADVQALVGLIEQFRIGTGDAVSDRPARPAASEQRRSVAA